MRIAVYTLTRERLAYTQTCFASLHEKAGVPYDHFIIDNGSQDGTAEWLKERAHEFKRLTFLPQNAGISVAANLALDQIKADGHYDLIVKFDNDCLVDTPGILAAFVSIYTTYQQHLLVLSPSVRGIHRSPPICEVSTLGCYGFAQTSIVGGLFHVVQPRMYDRFRYDVNLPLARGQDDQFCAFAKGWGASIGYIQGLWVEHYETTEGQAKRYPEYFERKWREEALGIWDQGHPVES